jgi:hypothetical protein
MSEHTFRYQQHLCAPDIEHPQGRPCLRPVLRTEIGWNGVKTPVFSSLLDTGADRCFFPLQYGKRIGLIADSDEHDGLAAGAGDDNISTFYRTVIINVEDIETWTMTAAFSAKFDRMKMGVLGGLGFFDRFQVRFDMANGLFHIATPGKRPSTHD